VCLKIRLCLFALHLSLKLPGNQPVPMTQGQSHTVLFFPDKQTVALTINHASKSGVFGHVMSDCSVLAAYGPNTDVRQALHLCQHLC
jgi:hypothetical protein